MRELMEIFIKTHKVNKLFEVLDRITLPYNNNY